MEKTVAVSLEHRFFVHEGRLYTKLSFPYSYWRDYLRFFEKVVVVARAKPIDEVNSEFARVDGPGVLFVEVPYYFGPLGFIKSLPRLIGVLGRVSRKYPAFIMRSGNVTNLLWFFVLLRRKPYLREYPGNIREGVAGYIGKGFGVAALAAFLDALGRVQARFSKANSFVSESCRSLYGSERPGFLFSSFLISEVGVQKNSYVVGSRLKIVSVGRLEKEKGHAVLIEAARQLGARRVELIFIGDGTQRVVLEQMCNELGVAAAFEGAITDRARLFELVGQADIFVLPSLTEGMPRALLEAMAIGMPCIGSDVGGIPEILPAGGLVPAGDVGALAARINELATSERARKEFGQTNRTLVSERFSEDAMRVEKRRFWSALYE